MKILITGGAGFIGSALARSLAADLDNQVMVFDAMTYAGSHEVLRPVWEQPNFHFRLGDLRNPEQIESAIRGFRPDVIAHLAAESHVDRSVDGPAEFVQTNIVGTMNLLEASARHHDALPAAAQEGFRFLHVSTDEVYGSLGATGQFTEETAYDPRSPYSASKAASDHLASAWFHTYGLPVVITNCSNNYGPWQFPEKLVPLMITRACTGQTLPVYGSGEQVRDWLHVEDHAHGLIQAIRHGIPGRSYNFGGRAERTNLEVVHAICSLLDELAPTPGGKRHASRIRHVTDRPGHDARYAVDCARAEQELGFQRLWSFETGLRATVRWYLDHPGWLDACARRGYRGQRLGARAPQSSRLRLAS